MPTKCPHSSHPSNLQDRTSAQLLTSPFHGGAESRVQIPELRVPMLLQMPRGPLSKHAAPASERCSAVCKAQSLGSSLIHTIPAPHQWLLCLEDTGLLFTHSLAVKRPPPQSGSESHYAPARKGEESPDAPEQKNAQRRGVNLMHRHASYQPSRFRWTITSCPYKVVFN